MMARIEHAGAAPETTLAAPIGSGDLSLVADDLSGYPTGAVGSFYIVIDPGTSSAEKILLSTRSGNNATVAAGGRGADDTVAVPHLAGAVIQHIFTAIEADEANAHIESDSGVHGVSTQIVGVDDTQTLTNKTISGASNTFSNIPLSAVLFAAGWESALGAVLGTNWADAFDTALGTNWTTAFANALGANWTDALDTALGTGWPTELAAALDTALVHTEKTQTLENKTISPDDGNTLYGWVPIQFGTVNGQTSWTVSSIPSGFEMLRFHGRGNMSGAGVVELGMRFNGTGGSYDYHLYETASTGLTRLAAQDDVSIPRMVTWDGSTACNFTVQMFATASASSVVSWQSSGWRAVPSGNLSFGGGETVGNLSVSSILVTANTTDSFQNVRWVLEGYRVP